MTAEAISIRWQVMQKTAEMWTLWSKGKPSQALKVKREIDDLERRIQQEDANAPKGK